MSYHKISAFPIKCSLTWSSLMIWGFCNISTTKMRAQTFLLESVFVVLMKSILIKKRATANCCLCFILWYLKRVYSVVLSFASSVHQWGLWEKAVTSHQGALEAVWGRHLFKGNQHIQKLDCGSATVNVFAGVYFLTPGTPESLF